VAWLGWSLARCGFEGRRRSRSGKQHGCFQLDLQVHESALENKFSQRNPTCHRSCCPSLFFPHPTQQAAALVSGRGEGQRAPCHRAPLTHPRCSTTYKPSITKQQPPPRHTERTQHTYSSFDTGISAQPGILPDGRTLHGSSFRLAVPPRGCGCTDVVTNDAPSPRGD